MQQNSFSIKHCSKAVSLDDHYSLFLFHGPRFSPSLSLSLSLTLTPSLSIIVAISQCIITSSLV